MIAFFKCTHCGHVSDLQVNDAAYLKYVQSKPHNFFWGSPAKCEGTITVPSTEEAWVKQECRPYPHERITKFLQGQR